MVTLKDIWEKFEVLVSQRDRLSKSVTVAPNDRYVVAPYVQPVILFDSNAKPVEGLGTDGKLSVTETSAATISATATTQAGWLTTSKPPTIGLNAVATNATDQVYLQRRIGRVTSTLVNGALADVALVPALASYYGVLKIKYVYMLVAPAGGTIQLTFQDEDNVAQQGLGTDGITTITPVAATVNTQLENVVLTQGTKVVNKALEVDLDTGGGAPDNGKVVVIGFEYWYEA